MNRAQQSTIPETPRIYRLASGIITRDPYDVIHFQCKLAIDNHYE